MCLLVLAWKTAPSLPLLLAGNRDERHARPAAPVHWWQDEGWVGGRDLEAGGTWLAADRAGRFAVVTNIPGVAAPAAARSRGALVPDYLRGGGTPHAYLAALASQPDRYPGFSLLVGDADSVAYYSNADGAGPKTLAPGYYGLGNEGLDGPSARLHAVRERMRALLERDGAHSEALFGLWSERADTHGAQAPFVVGSVYGTRATTLLVRTAGEMRIEERTYLADASALPPRSLRWQAAA